MYIYMYMLMRTHRLCAHIYTCMLLHTYIHLHICIHLYMHTSPAYLQPDSYQYMYTVTYVVRYNYHTHRDRDRDRWHKTDTQDRHTLRQYTLTHRHPLSVYSHVSEDTHTSVAETQDRDTRQAHSCEYTLTHRHSIRVYSHVSVTDTLTSDTHASVYSHARMSILSRTDTLLSVYPHVSVSDTLTYTLCINNLTQCTLTDWLQDKRQYYARTRQAYANVFDTPCNTGS